MKRGEGQGFGFQPVEGEADIVTFVMATGSGCSAGDALTNTASQTGKLIQATSGTTRIYAVAATTVASSSSGTPNVLCVSLSNHPRFRVQADAAVTAANLLQHVALEAPYQIDPNDTTSTSGAVFFLEEIDPSGVATAFGRFSRTPYTDHT